ncbi:MAG: hypothetical protein Q7T41_04120 [Candidatus Saccharibacteria bacterium]|nr:hypothetical protein [Candidatus Saccharibacteria bacterium]
MAEFSTDIHPQYSGIPDTQFAQAASEFALRASDFAIVMGNRTSSDFPPEPSYPSVLQLAYTEEAPDGSSRVRRQFVGFDTGSAHLKTFAGEYAKKLKPFEDILTDAEEQVDPNKQEFLKIAPNLSRNAGLRTVAGFVLFRSARNSKQFYSGLLVPKITTERTPLEFRNILVSLMGQVGGKNELAEHFRELGNDDGSDILGQVMRLENTATNAGAMFAAMHLPKISRVKEIVRAQTTPAPHQGPSREQRRAFRK